MKFSIKYFFSKCDQIRTFTGKTLKGKLNFLCSVSDSLKCIYSMKEEQGKLSSKHLMIKIEKMIKSPLLQQEMKKTNFNQFCDLEDLKPQPPN